jgi:capsular polysaccharide biosynthesis protein
VIELLENYGFQIINAEDCSLEEQVKLASATRCFISNHGAGLTNILFMNPGANVLELRHRADKTNNCYFSLASAAGLNYFYQTCEPAVAGEDPHTADLLVDIETLKRNVEEIVSAAGTASTITT